MTRRRRRVSWATLQDLAASTGVRMEFDPDNDIGFVFAHGFEYYATREAS